MRTIKEIEKAENEYYDRVWYDRKQIMLEAIRQAREEVPPEEILDGMQNHMQKVERKYGKHTLGPYTDFEWGMINGKLSALRWIFGEEWDMLDT